MSADPLVDELHALLGAQGVLSSAADCARYEQGWRYGSGKARCVARPRTSQECALVLACCRKHAAHVLPQGANTGLVAASTPDNSGTMVVLSTDRLTRTIEVDAASRTALVDAGVTLSQLNEAAAKHGLWFPIDLGADPAIGGMVATNTGGTRLLKYGDVRKNLLGLEVVLADGRVVSELNSLRKNNTGLDIKQLFVGTFGAFGVVTRAVVQLAPLPQQRATALVACTCGSAVVRLLVALERELGDALSAFEVMGAAALGAVFAQHSELRRPFAELPTYAVLVEASSTLPSGHLALEDVLQGQLASYLEICGEEVADVVLGDGEAFWHLRHLISESLRATGKMLAFDVSVPRSRMPEFTEAVRELLAATHAHVQLCDYGHWGDGGTHLNLVWQAADAQSLPVSWVSDLQAQIYELVVRTFAGSYSAEHGIGPHNQRFYDRFASPVVAELCDLLQVGLLGGQRLGAVRLGVPR